MISKCKTYCLSSQQVQKQSYQLYHLKYGRHSILNVYVSKIAKDLQWMECIGSVI